MDNKLGEGRRWKEDIFSKAAPGGVDDGQAEGHSVWGFRLRCICAQADYGPPGLDLQ